MALFEGVGGGRGGQLRLRDPKDKKMGEPIPVNWCGYTIKVLSSQPQCSCHKSTVKYPSTSTITVKNFLCFILPQFVNT